MSRLPSLAGNRFATVFEHGSLSVEIYAPRPKDPPQPQTRDQVHVWYKEAVSLLTVKAEALTLS